MTIDEILSHVDHTLLSPSASPNDIRKLCLDAITYHTASVCIPPCYVSQAAQIMDSFGKNSTPAVCTVIGFPNGNTTTASKTFEAADALENGADELDMVFNIGWLKNGYYNWVEQEIRQIKSACCPDNILKVIIETCMLTDEEKICACQLVTNAGADYIKTSTGFSTGGATFEDVSLLKANIGPGVKVKAAGGIRSLEDAEQFLLLGADRLGTSRIVQLAKDLENKKEVP